jgi:hypothetical protein
MAEDGVDMAHDLGARESQRAAKMLICRCKEGTERRVTRGELENLGGAPTATSSRALEPSDVQPCCRPRISAELFFCRLLQSPTRVAGRGDLIAIELLVPGLASTTCF